MNVLAALVAKPDVDVAIASLREEGVHDDSRRLVEYDDETVAIPVTEPPRDTRVRDVIEQVDPEPRVTDLSTLLRERGFSAAEIERAPGSWAVIGSVILVRFDDCERREAVGEALLELHRGADTVLARGGVSGEHREPAVEVVAGEGDTETVHTEHGTHYAMDLSRVMFAPGNKAERARMGEIVGDGELVLDMFAGIGYFTLPMARAGATVTAIEKNPVAFQFLTENARLNEVEDRVSLFLGDCRETVPLRVEAGDRYDRVVMGYYDAHEYLEPALAALEPGGTVHMHEATPEALLWDRPVDRLKAAVEAADRTVRSVDRHRIKSHSEGVAHVVLDAVVD
ncbi:MAG: class I SAM-dependent methyltransferase family protein [Halodesulfurarchaeum sp.]|nr:class I SAM-dependent methyltransferase family protein [Halodesulfurarchaeum sp.]